MLSPDSNDRCDAFEVVAIVTTNCDAGLEFFE